MTDSRYSIDRFEGDVAVCYDLEDDTKIEIPKYLLPNNAREGDIIEEKEEGFTLDPITTRNRLESLSERFKKLKGDK